MTDQQAALTVVAHSEFREQAAALLESFQKQWQNEALVMNQWFSIQASDPTEGVLDRVRKLEQHPLFDTRNPNKLRSLIAAFCMRNQVNFHAEDGSGYEYLGDWIVRLNSQNPQIAARLLTPLTRWRQYPPKAQTLMRKQLLRLQAMDGLAKDLYEVVSKSLA